MVRLAATGAVAALLAWRVEWDALGRLSEPAAWPLLVAAALVGLLAVPLKLVVWRATVVPIMPQGARAVSRRALAMPFVVGAALNTLLPARAGEVARVALARKRLARRGATPRAAALAGSIASESLYAAIGWAVFALGVAVVAPVPTAAWYVGACLAAVFVTLVAVAGRTGRAPGDAGTRGAAALRAGDAWRSLLAGQRITRRPMAFAALLVASIGAWVVQAVAVLLVLGAFGLAGAIGIAGAALVVVTLAVAQFVPVLPGNLGLFQAAVALPLVGTYGVDANTAVVVATVLQAVQMLPLLLLAGALLAADRLGARRVAERRTLSSATAPEA